jgi:hypothetical protein
MKAVDEGNTSLVKSLLAAGADVNAISDGGKTALMRAVTKGYLDIVQVLLDAGADVNAKKENGSTALIIAVFFGYAEIVRALLARGADPEVQTPLGTTPEKWAQSMGFTEIVELLKNAEAIRAQGLRTESGQRDVTGLFPGDGPFRAVVPLSEIDETHAVEVPPPTSTSASFAEGEARQAGRLGTGEPAPEEREDATVVQPRAAQAAPLAATPATPLATSTAMPAMAAAANNAAEPLVVAAPATATAPVDVPPTVVRPAAPRAPFAPRLKSTLQSGPFTALVLVLVLIVGVILDADWKNSRRAAETAPPAPPALEGAPAVAETGAAADAPPTALQPAAEPAAELATESAPPLTSAPAPDIVSNAPAVSTIAPDVPEPKAERAPRVVEAPAPAVASESRRVAVEEPAARREAVAESRGRRPVSTAGAERDESPAREAARPDARAVRRTQNTEGQVLTSSSSPNDPWPVFSPKSPAKSAKKKVIQWP